MGEHGVTRGRSRDRGALARLARRLSAEAQPGRETATAARMRLLVALRRAILGAAALVFAVPAVLAIWPAGSADPGPTIRQTRGRTTIAADSDLPAKPLWESSSNVVLVTSFPSTAPDAHPSERCLPITDLDAARCYVRAARDAPSDERVLRNLIIAHRWLDDWDSTSRLAAIYWRRYPSSPFLSGIRPLVFGPDMAIRPMLPPGLAPASWTEHLAGVAPGEIEAFVERASRIAADATGQENARRQKEPLLRR